MHCVKKVFSGPYFSAFGLNTERSLVSLHVQSECGKMRTKKNSVFAHFSRSDDVCNLLSIQKLEDFTFMFLNLLRWIYVGVAANSR